MNDNLPARHPAAPPGWYELDSGGTRYWDGVQWTGAHMKTPAVPTSNAALWSTILGAVGLIINPLALLGLPLGLVALGDVRRGAKAGLGLAVAGVTLNGVVWLVWAAIGLYALLSA